MTHDAYRDFLAKKLPIPDSLGFDVDDSEIHPLLKEHQRLIVRWMVAGGRRACFAAFGLGKSLIQLETVRLTRDRGRAQHHARGIPAQWHVGGIGALR